MNSFISSSKKRILKSFAAFMLMFAAYGLFLFFAEPRVTIYQNQFSENYATAQNYIYSRKPYGTVIVGTSMSHRLLENASDGEIYNLAFSGGSALSGLNILVESGKIPDRILIEINDIEKETDEEMIHRLFTPVFWNVKEYLPALQEKYQPINVFMSFVRSFSPSNKNADFKQDPVVLKKMLSRHLERMGNRRECIGSEALADLKSAIQYLQEKGAQIIFFRMPVHPEIANSKLYAEKMELLRREFGDMVWLPMPEDVKYATTDGIHLTHSGASEFSIKLNEWVHVITQKPDLFVDRTASNI